LRRLAHRLWAAARLRRAGALARTRPLGPCPGWHFGAGEADATEAVTRRLAIWTRCKTTGREQRVKIGWYDGLKVFLYLANDTSRALYVGGCYEPNEFFFLSKVLRRGMTFVDVGANEGLYALFAAPRVGPTGVVLAIEPSGREFARLEDNIRLNRLRNVATFRLALFSHPGSGELAIAEGQHSGQNVLGRAIPNPQVRCQGVERVELKRLDDLLGEVGVPRLDFLKADAEGAEKHVLAGGERSIGTHRPLLQVEMNEAALVAQGSSREDLFDMLRSWDYRVYRFDESGALAPAENADILEGNVIAAPVGRDIL